MLKSNRDARRRIEQLEDAFDVTDGPPPSEKDLARKRIACGTATVDDFVTVFQDDLDFARAVIVARSPYFALVRYHGFEPWAWGPLDVAASIAALPLGTEPSERLLERSTWRVGQQLLRPKGKSQVARLASHPGLHSLWVETNLNALALGSPDGLPLREQMADGTWDGAVEAVLHHPDLQDFAIVNTPARRPWHELPAEFPRSTPFGMTDEQARNSQPPWHVRDWWPDTSSPATDHTGTAEQPDPETDIDLILRAGATVDATQNHAPRTTNDPDDAQGGTDE